MGEPSSSRSAGWVSVCADATTKNNTEPERGVFTFAEGDLYIELARKTGKIMRGAHLVSVADSGSALHRSSRSRRTQLRVVQPHPCLGDGDQMDCPRAR